MSFPTRDLMEQKNEPELRSEDGEPIGYPDPTHDYWFQAISDFQTVAGQVVNATTAQKSAAVFACITAISESVAMLPLMVNEEIDERRSRKRKDHYLYRLLSDEPNPWNDSFQFFETLQTNALCFGDAFAHKQMTKSGRITRLTILPSDKMTVKMGEDNELQYIYQGPGGTQHFTRKDIFHFMHHSADGLTGRSPLRVAADTVGFNLGLLKHGNKIFENGAFLSGFLKTAARFKDDEARERFMNSFKKFFGANNAGKMGLLEQGVEFEPFSMNNRDSQFLEFWQLSVLDIARIFRVPPYMIQVVEGNAGYASVEQRAIHFVQYTTQPWATRWEKALKRQLMLDDPGLYVKFNINAMLRGDLKSRTEAIVQQLQYGLKTINEARALDDENPIEHPLGDTIMVSHNLKTADAAMQQASSPDPIPAPKAKESVKSSREAFLPLFQDLLSRVKRRELSAIKEHVGKEGFLKWADGFLVRHEEILRQTIRPACHAFSREFETSMERFISNYLEDRRFRFLNYHDKDLLATFTEKDLDWPEFLLDRLEESNDDADEPRSEAA